MLRGHISSLNGEDHDIERLDQIRALQPTTDDWQRLLEDAPVIRKLTIGKFGVPWNELCKHLKASYNRFAFDYSDVFGYIGLFLLTTLLLDMVERRQSVDEGTDGDPRDSDDKEDDLQSTWQFVKDLVLDDRVRKAIHVAYCPPETTTETSAEEFLWKEMSLPTMSLHALGTTSFILNVQGRPTSSDAEQPLALKCLLYPYTAVPLIVEATAEYATKYGGGGSPHLAAVHASTGKWIAMEFVRGDTLRDWLTDKLRPQFESGAERAGLRFDLLEEMAGPLFVALDELRENKHLRQRNELGPAKVVHQDLSLTNVIVDDSVPSVSLKLVDLGPNFLYSRAIAVLTGPEAAYVPPEVKRNPSEDHQLADVYSLGQILVALGGATPNTDGTVPDRYYEYAPLLARFIEDLIDADESRRLLILSPDKTWTFITLCDAFEQELGAAIAMRRAKAEATDERWFQGILQLVLPSSRSPWRLLKLYRERKKQTEHADHARDGLARWLLIWSIVCASSWYVTSSIVFWWTLRDIGLGVAPLPIEIVQKLIHASQHIPILDMFQSPSYRIGLRENVTARLVGITMALLGTKYYQNIYAELTPLLGVRFGGWRRRLAAYVTEFLMRMFAFWWVPLVLVPNLHDPRLWSICYAIAATGSLITNWVVRWFCWTAIRLGRQARLRTVPVTDQALLGLTKFSSWAVTGFVYTLFVWPTAILIYAGVLKDEFVYMSGAALVNVGLLYIVKCGLDASAVRGGIARAYLAAERLCYVNRDEWRAGTSETHLRRRQLGAPEASGGLSPDARRR